MNYFKQKKTSIFWITFTSIIISAGVFHQVSNANNSDTKAIQLNSENSKAVNKLLVSVVDIRSQTQRPIVTGFGEVSAKWTTQLTAQVSGQVDVISEKLLVGKAFKKSNVLAKINNIDYQMNLASAQADVASAQLSFLEQQRETQQAQERWTLSGLMGKPSSLTLQLPQLENAQAALNSAKAALVKAKKDLDRTHIRAPYNGRVSSRNINLGGYVSAGTVIAEIFADDIMEISIALNEQKFALLGNEKQLINQKVQLEDTTNPNNTWTATIARFQYHIDSTNRTRNIVLQVDTKKTHQSLLPGTFVKAFIKGQAMNDLVKIPASALSRDGYIWHVNNDLLHRFKADIAYRKDDYLVVKTLNQESQLSIVRYPQAGFVNNQAVNTQASQWLAKDQINQGTSKVTSAQLSTKTNGAGA